MSERDDATTPTDTGAAWLPVSEAAVALGVSEKTIRRRIKAGELTASKEPMDGGGIAWRVQIGSEMDNGMDTRRNRNGQRDGHNHAQGLNTMDKRAGTGLDIAVGDRREIEAELRAQLVRERELSAFLKSQIEDANRNAAELRAALRKALEIAPRQLPAGTPQRDQAGAAPNHSHAEANGPHRPAKRDDTPLTYSDIADELERNLNR